jgi:hypothetical protein
MAPLPVNEKSTVSAACASTEGSMPDKIAEPAKLWVSSTFKVSATIVPINAKRFVCAVSDGSMNPVTLAVHELMVGMFIAQLPDAPNGVTSFVAFFIDNVHLEESENPVGADALAPIPANAVNAFSPS